MTQIDEIDSFIFSKCLQAVLTQHGQHDSEDRAACPILLRESHIPEKGFLISMKDTKNQDLKS